MSRWDLEQCAQWVRTAIEAANHSMQGPLRTAAEERLQLQHVRDLIVLAQRSLSDAIAGEEERQNRAKYGYEVRG
jgi:hypothetical protein